MDRLRPKDLIPVTVFAGFDDMKSDNDLRYLGRENLRYLANFWDDRKKRFSNKLANEPSPLKRNDFQDEIDNCERKRDHLLKLASQSPSKPPFLEKRVFHVGSKVTCFTTSPDRYVSGTIVRVYVDEESDTGSFSIRVYDKDLFTKSYDLQYEPDGHSLYLAKDFEYYCAHPDYFRFVLDYCSKAATLSEIAYIDRMMAVLPQPHA